MSSLSKLIKNSIKTSGPITLSQYMTLSLYHPKFGYYINNNPLGKKGDFITSPEISQTFGELIGLWFTDIWKENSRKKNVIFQIMHRLGVYRPSDF